MSGVRRALGFSFATRYFELVVGLGASLVLARLLTPAQIGVYSVVSVFVVIAHMLRDFGVAQYIVQAPSLDSARIRTAFTVTLLLAWSAALVLALLGAPLAAFFNEAGVGEVLRVIALNFLIIPFGSVTLDLLNRDMRFDLLLRIKSVAALCHAATAIGLALLGFGYLSLAWAAVANVAATAAMALLYRPDTLSFAPGLQHLREILRFGSLASIATLSRAAGEAAPDLVIGKLMGMGAVGLFSRAVGTVQLFTRAVLIGVRPIVLPHFARGHRAGEPLAAQYLDAQACLIALGWPFFALLALLAQPVLRTLYGDQWDAAAPLVQILCAAGALRLLQAFSGDVLVAVGRIDLETRTQVVVQGFTVVAVLAGARYGLAGVACALTLSAALGHAVLALVVFPALGISNRAVHRVLGAGLLITALAAAPVRALRIGELVPATVDSSLQGLRVLALAMPLTLLAWWLGLRLTGNPLLGEMRRVLASARARQERAPPSG